jgi:hypothetical protein
VFYQPKFTYIWTLGIGRFPDALRQRVSRETALREIARGFLDGAGMTVPGELARVTGLPRRDAGLGNRALVAEGYAAMPARGTYRLISAVPRSGPEPGVLQLRPGHTPERRHSTPPPQGRGTSPGGVQPHSPLARNTPSSATAPARNGPDAAFLEEIEHDEELRAYAFGSGAGGEACYHRKNGGAFHLISSPMSALVFRMSGPPLDNHLDERMLEPRHSLAVDSSGYEGCVTRSAQASWPWA